MKNTKICPKCNSSDIVRIDGYTEEWIDREDIEKVKNSKKAKR